MVDTFIVVLLALIVTLFLLSVNPLLNTELVFFLIYVFYYVFMEGAFGKTIGKLSTQSQVVFLKPKQKWFWVFVRTLMRLNPFDAVSYLFGMNTGSHDVLSFTRVVDRY
jgi:uncharacterized RDD family membrane protein YckC